MLGRPRNHLRKGLSGGFVPPKVCSRRADRPNHYVGGSARAPLTTSTGVLQARTRTVNGCVACSSMVGKHRYEPDGHVRSYWAASDRRAARYKRTSSYFFSRCIMRWLWLAGCWYPWLSSSSCRSGQSGTVRRSRAPAPTSYRLTCSANHGAACMLTCGGDRMLTLVVVACAIHQTSTFASLFSSCVCRLGS